MNLGDHLLRMREAKSVVSFLFCFYLLEGEKGGGLPTENLHAIVREF